MLSRDVIPLVVPDDALRTEAVTPRRTTQKRAVEERPTSSIIRSKVQSPVVRASTLERRRLLGWLERHTADRVSVVAAEAGYGKTTLIADFARRTQSAVAWYRLETSDRDWLTFLGYLVAAVREVVPTFGTSTSNLLAQVAAMGPTRAVAVGTLLSELNDLGERRLLLVLDDVHLVHESEDVQAILERLFELAPAGMTFVLAGRQRPALRLGRLLEQGDTAELTTDDLRFSRRETEDLFAVSYGLALDDDIVSVIDARTEGWVASLQLVYSSIRSSAPHEVREFVRDLSGTTKPLYEFLAEEVLGRQPPLVQRILIHASLLKRIVADLVVAALAVTPDPPGIDEVSDCLESADEQGLMSRSAVASATRRFHPLLSEFLLRQLTILVPAETIAEMHLSIARAAESTDWLTAAHHFLEGGLPHEAMRVLSESTMRTLGTGGWGPATELVDRMPSVEPPLTVQVIKARALVALSRVDEALALLETLYPAADDSEARGLIRLAKAGAYHNSGRAADLQLTLADILSDPQSPPDVLAIGRAWTLIMQANAGGPLGPVAKELATLALNQANDGLHYFAAVSYHNAMLVDMARGLLSEAIALGDEALHHFGRASCTASETASTKVTIAACAMELGRAARARKEYLDAATRPDAAADATADCAWIAAASGDVSQAWLLLDRATRLTVAGADELGARSAVLYARAMAHIAEGEVGLAEEDVEQVTGHSSEVDASIRRLTTKAVLAILRDNPSGEELANEALRLARLQGAHRWEPVLRVLLATAKRDGPSLQRYLTALANGWVLSLLSIADVVGLRLSYLTSPPSPLESSVIAFPKRWLPIFRRQLGAGNTPNAHAAAAMLSQYGTADDVTRIVAFERTYVRRTNRRALGRQLARRVAPTLVVHDLGRTAYAIGDRDVRLSQTRRKAAALLLYLAARPGQTATREQVLDDLWPDQDPVGASNSLHQTLFFLRRDIDPWYEDGVSVDYVAVESELVYLDPDLVQIKSVAFLRQAVELMSTGRVVSNGAQLLREYSGRFAPEFEYEEWSMAWRDRVHSTFLLLAQATQEALTRDGSTAEAVESLTWAMGVESSAIDLEQSLIQSLLVVNAVAAASAQYQHFAATYRVEYGVEPPSLDDLRGRPGPTASVKDN